MLNWISRTILLGSLVIIALTLASPGFVKKIKLGAFTGFESSTTDSDLALEAQQPAIENEPYIADAREAVVIQSVPEVNTSKQSSDSVSSFNPIGQALASASNLSLNNPGSNQLPEIEEVLLPVPEFFDRLDISRMKAEPANLQLAKMNLSDKQQSSFMFVSKEDDEVSADTEKPELKNSLTRSLSGFIDSAQDVFGESQTDLKKDLYQADRALTRAKLTNSKAIAAVNRQVRISGASSPNILLLVFEGLSAEDLNPSSKIKSETPKFDSVRKAGTTFDNYYANTNRQKALASLYTGKVGFEDAQAAKVTMSRVMWDAGYSTVFIGDGYDALSLGQAKIDHFFGEIESPNEVTPQFPEVVMSGEDEVGILANKNSEPEDDISWTKLYLNELSTYLDGYNNRRPFMITVNLKADYFTTKRGEKAPLGSPQRKELIERMDQFLGELVAELAKTRAGRSTHLIVTSSDPAVPATQQTAALDEESLKVPLIILGSSKWIDQETDYIAGMQDVLPTMLDLVKANRRPPVDGYSLSDVLNGTHRKTNKHRIFRFDVNNNKNLESAVRIGKWKAVFGAEDQLFDLETDPTESNDLSDRQPSVLRQLREHGNIPTENL